MCSVIKTKSAHLGRTLGTGSIKLPHQIQRNPSLSSHNLKEYQKKPQHVRHGLNLIPKNSNIFN